MRTLDREGADLVGIFDSHPATPAYPSSTDIRLAYYPDAFYIICSLQNPRRPVIRAFRIRNGTVKEEPIEIIRQPPLVSGRGEGKGGGRQGRGVHPHTLPGPFGGHGRTPAAGS